MFDILFHPEAQEELYALESSLQAKYLVALEKLEAKGHLLRHPHSAPIGDGLFELRAGGKDITRTFFAFAEGKKIYILRTFVKKTRKTPKSEIDLAKKRLEEMI